MRSNNSDMLKKVFVGFKLKDTQGKELDPGKCSIEEIYAAVVEGPAYRDFTSRTIKGLKKENVLVALQWLEAELKKYFEDAEKDKDDFDEWHKNTCREFCKRFSNCCGKEIADGKAQKIVNMSFKYLFCIGATKQYPVDKFKYCHMPLDAYTLDWFADKVVDGWYNEGKNRKEKIHLSKIRENPWSNLEYGDPDTPYSYAWIQQTIRKYLNSDSNEIYREKDNTPLTPFAAEFYIWPERQWKLAVKNLLGQAVLKDPLNPQDGYPAYCAEELEKDYCAIEEKLKGHKFRQKEQ